jgi:Icc-related predicted phosphoesterase
LRIGWLTDIHLNFVPPEGRSAFYSRIQSEKLDGLLIGGDIGEADSVNGFLAEIAGALDEIPVYFVLGNHDFYRGSIRAVRQRVTQQCVSLPRLHWLPAAGIVPLTDETALIGHDSWADGRLGDFFGSDVMMNDYVLIGELAGLPKPQLLAKLNALGDEAALFLEDRARQALAQRRNLLVLTHVPPFREACWHEGQVSGDAYLPHFACRAVGDRLAALMREHPRNNMTILCGHTHSSGVVQILDNLSVITGAAKYGQPEPQRVFDLA